MRWLAVVATMMAVVGASAPVASAGTLTPTITEFRSGLPAGGDPADIVTGPDGALWFTDQGSGGAIGRMTTGGKITEFHAGLPSGSTPFGITAGSDGNLWFTDPGVPAIGRITPGGTITEFRTGLGSGSSPYAIAAGPDGNLWFTDRGSTPAIGRITPAGNIDEFTSGLAGGSSPGGIAAGPDGRLWFADGGSTAAIGRATAAGAIHEFTSGLKSGSRPADIAAGADGNLWFTDQGSTSAVGRISTSGSIHEFTSGLGLGSFPQAIAAAADGAVWFADRGTPPAIGRATTTGDIDEFGGGLSSSARPNGLGNGPDGNVWFTDRGANAAIGRITTPPSVVSVGALATGATTAAVVGEVDGHAQHTTFHLAYGPPGATATDTRDRSIGTITGDAHVSAPLTGLRPGTAYRAAVVATNSTGTSNGAFLDFITGPPKDRLTRLRIRPTVLVTAARGGPVTRARRAGALIIYNGTQPATTTFTVQRLVEGRRHGHACVPRTKRNRRARRCLHYVDAGRFTHNDVVGLNRFRFSGRVHSRRLRRGDYRLIAVPRSAGGIGAARHARFSVKR